MNSYMKWLYEFMSIWIHVYKFQREDSELVYEFISIWIHTKEFILSNLDS